ncbi:MAG: methyltransferase [Deltaproteobacteria bacterium]|nr:methyltransferase [Deltaproteobacteria bacterium]
MRDENEKYYKQRWTRIQSAINFELIDRVPCIFMGTAFAPRYMGMTQHQFCLDPDAAVDVTIAAMTRLGDVDGINLMPFGIVPMALTGAWFSKVLIPGIDLDADALWQVHEKETMTVDDYDLVIDKGIDALAQKLLPQVCDMKLMEAHMAWCQTGAGQVAGKFREAGYGIVASSATSIPFESLCGARSMEKFYFDLYRMPDKVQAAMDVMLPFSIEIAKSAVNVTGVPSVWVGGWRTASAMLAPKLWDRFVWPYFFKVASELIASGITPVFHWDQDWGRDLGRLLELPAKKCILNPDGMTDIRKARTILKDHTAIMGDVPAAIFSSGTPDDVRNYIRDLVRDVGPEGLLLAPGCDAPLNAKPENMEAFVAASHEFGTV